MASLPPLILRYSARARAHLLSIHDHLEKEGNAAAIARVGAGIREAVEILRYFPQAGRPGRIPGTREWVTRRLPYIVVYEIYPGGPGEVVILGVFHARQARP
ncbi:MAG: type II toxin-antitoxin system RelE/ParE family toxin [Alphaproteobacteria bacterium]|nr:type II toxin-antitoxin system RelE/ParE family toxin [Alphaproteobacteria bacterium]